MKGAKLLQELRLLNLAFYRTIMRETEAARNRRSDFGEPVTVRMKHQEALKIFHMLQ